MLQAHTVGPVPVLVSGHLVELISLLIVSYLLSQVWLSKQYHPPEPHTHTHRLQIAALSSPCGLNQVYFILTFQEQQPPLASFWLLDVVTAQEQQNKAAWKRWCIHTFMNGFKQSPHTGDASCYPELTDLALITKLLCRSQGTADPHMSGCVFSHSDRKLTMLLPTHTHTWCGWHIERVISFTSDLIHIWPTIYYNLHLEQSLKTLTLSGINWWSHKALNYY